MTDPVQPVQPVVPVQPVAVVNGPRPGFGLGVAGLIIDFFIPILGLILSIVGKVQSSRAGVKNGPATVGIVLGIIFTIGAIIGIVVAVTALGGVAAECATLGAGHHVVNGVTYTCGG
jgi:hypothetical protein